MSDVTKASTSPITRKHFPPSQGVTFRVQRGEVVVARVLHGGCVHRQGMLHAGDVIRQVNGQEVGRDPGDLQRLLKDVSGSLTLRVVPAYKDTPPPPQVCLRVWTDRQTSVDPCEPGHMSVLSSGLPASTLQLRADGRQSDPMSGGGAEVHQGGRPPRAGQGGPQLVAGGCSPCDGRALRLLHLTCGTTPRRRVTLWAEPRV